jgi:hypothetical protein
MEEAMMAIREQLITGVQSLVADLVSATPKVVTGILFIVLALIIAKVIERTLRSLLVRIRFDGLLTRLGLDETLAAAGIEKSPSEFLSRLAYYLLLFLFARAVVDALGIAVISQTMGAFLAYLPNLVAAILILVLGSAGGQVAGRAVARSAEAAGIEYGSSLGSLVSTLILFIAGIMAVGQLQIDTDIVRIVTICLLAGLSLAFGLTFGLGTREITRNIIAGYYARKVFHIGDDLEIRGERGKLKSITPTTTIIENDRGTVAISNAAFLQDTVKRQ